MSTDVHIVLIINVTLFPPTCISPRSILFCRMHIDLFFVIMSILFFSHRNFSPRIYIAPLTLSLISPSHLSDCVLIKPYPALFLTFNSLYRAAYIYQRKFFILIVIEYRFYLVIRISRNGVLPL